MTLHEAIEKVLKNKGRSMTAREIADEINAAGLYKRKDGNPVPTSQIHARISNYPAKFVKVKNQIGLFSSPKSIFENFRSEKPKTLEDTLEELTREIYANYNLPEAESVILVCSLAIASKKIGIKIDREGLPLAYEAEAFIMNLSRIIEENQELSEVFEILIKNRKILTKEFFRKISFDIGYLVNQLSNDELNEILIHYINNVGFFGKQRFLARFNTPDFLNSLLISLADIQVNEVVFDPAAGLGKTLAKVYAENKNNLLIGQEIDYTSYLINKLYFFLLGVEKYELQWTDSIKNPKIVNKAADVIISDIPFGGRIKGREVEFPTLNRKNAYSSEEVFLEYMLSVVKSHGRIVTTIPIGLLFRSSNAYLREYLIEYDLIESIISLPSNSYHPYSSVNSALILINKNKSHNSRNKVLFINLDNSIDLKVSNNRLTYDDRQISRVIKELKFLLRDPYNQQSEIEYSLIDTNKIKSQGYDLSPNRYDQKVLSLLNKASKSGELVPLMDILERIPSYHGTQTNKYTKYIQIRDLSDDPIDFNLNLSKVKSTISGIPRYKILNESALLIARVGNNLKPTFFKAGDQEIAINQNILAYRVDERIINIGYLITQLNSEFFHKQLDLIVRGIGIPTFTPNSLLNLKIPVPPISEQLNRLSIFKDQYSQKLTLTQFINEIRLVNTNQEIKDEIERFASKTIPDANHIMFKREYEFDKFPYTRKDLEETSFIKRAKEGHYFNIFLHDGNKVTNGVLVVESEKEITYEQYSEINAYTNFILKTSSKYIQENTNRLLNEFSHTTKNILKDINKILSDFLETSNTEFLESMKSSLIKDEEMINYFIENENKKREDFLAYNRLKEAYRIVNKHFELFKRRHEYYTKSINTEPDQLELTEFIKRIPANNTRINISNHVYDDPVLMIRSAPIELAFTDLLGNALTHSNGGKIDLIISDRERFVEFKISNSVNNLLSKENYEMLGKEDIKKSDGTYSTGMSHAFRSINQENNISLCPYEKYKSSKKFEVTIKLSKK